MDAASTLELDVVILGGGCAGLWLLDDLRCGGVRAVLLEAATLGQGQTSCAQGILHGGLKYSLAGLLSSSARMVREMPAVWDAALEGSEGPDLRGVRERAAWCTLWRCGSLKSWTSMLAAVTALQVKPLALAEAQVPDVLAGCPRPVYRLGERVIDPLSFLSVLAEQNQGLVWRIDSQDGLVFASGSAGKPSPKSPDNAPAIELRQASNGRGLYLQPRAIVLAAGQGNAALRTQLGLPGEVMQRRPLRVALLRERLPGSNKLPTLNGHCVEGAKTRVTITTDVDKAGRTVWQLGGQVSETGVGLPREEFLQLAQRELAAVLPGWKQELLAADLEWAEFAVDRAERSTGDGLMPGDVQIVREGAVLTVWPTKLVMAPLLSRRVRDLLSELPAGGDSAAWQAKMQKLAWPAPAVALAPWNRELPWTRVD